MLAVVVKVVRMAWFVERCMWLWWLKGGGSEAVVESDVGGGGGWRCGWSKITITKE